jgi:hypothetical protein
MNNKNKNKKKVRSFRILKSDKNQLLPSIHKSCIFSSFEILRMSASNTKEDLQKEFRLFDTNNDGFIDKKELKVILQKILPKFKLPDEEIQRMISNVDKNNDGKIDYNGKYCLEISMNCFFLLCLEFMESIYPQLPK